MVQELISMGADINTKVSGITALGAASRKNHLDIIKLLCKRGADSAAVILDSVELNLFLFFSNTDSDRFSVDTFRELIFWAMLGKNSDATAIPSFMKACNEGISEVVLEHCKDVNATMPTTGATALMWACKSGHLDIVQTLCDGGANVHAVMKKNGLSALSIACLCGHIEVARELICRGVNYKSPMATGSYSFFLWACKTGNLALVEELCLRDVNVNCIDSHGYSALMLACSSSNPEVVRVLCNKAANVHYRRPKCGKTALILVSDSRPSGIAENNKRLEIVRELYKHGANVNASDSDGFTPLMCTVIKCNLGLVQELYDLGADVNARCIYGHTVLSLSVCYSPIGDEEDEDQRKYLEITRFLCNKGADMNAPTRYGFRVLMIACDRGLQNAVIELLKRGAKVNLSTAPFPIWFFMFSRLWGDTFSAKKRQGGWWLALKSLLWRKYTALDLVCRRNNLEIASLLLNAGAEKTPCLRETFKLFFEGREEEEESAAAWRKLLGYSEKKAHPRAGLWSCFATQSRVVPI